MTRKPTRNFSREIGAASAAILALLVSAGLEIRVTEKRKQRGWRL